jgi:hypothetical protein
MRLGSTALATGRAERRLAAILAADVAGYSRLMGADEEGTLDRLKALRRELSDPKIKEHRGRIVKTTGDGLLIEFASVVDAVRCAVEVQREMADRNADVPSDRRIEFRMGINLGDIIKDGRDIYGDGVNLSIDVRHWCRNGLLRPGQKFDCSWSRRGKRTGSIEVLPTSDAVILLFCWRASEEEKWKSFEQRVPLTWTTCHFGGARPWFVCTEDAGEGQCCSKRVAKL